MPETTSEPNQTAAALERRSEAALGLAGTTMTGLIAICSASTSVDPATARLRQRFESVARFIRDLIAQRWVKTRLTREQAKPKRIYYLSMEFLIGRALHNNMINLAGRSLHRSTHCARRVGTPHRFWSRSQMPAWATAALAGWPRVSSTHWPRCRSRRSDTGSVRVRHLQPVDRERLSGRRAGQLASSSRIPGRCRGRGRKSPFRFNCQLRAAGRSTT